MAPIWVLADPSLALARAEDWYRTTTQTSTRRRLRISDASECFTRRLAGKGKVGWRGPESVPDRHRQAEAVECLHQVEAA